MANEWTLKKDIIEIGSRLWQRQYIAANDGNITVRLNDNEFLATPTGVSKGFMNSQMIVKIDIQGNLLSSAGNYTPSSEIQMHLEVYKKRPEINAVVHAHPAYCTAFAVAGISLDKCVLPESIVSLGAVPIAEFALPSTMEVPESIRPFLEESDAILLQNHGAITFGKDLFDAYYRMETLEHSARIIWTAEQLGHVNVLPEKERERLLKLRDKYGLSSKIAPCKTSDELNQDEERDVKIKVTDETIREITRKVIDRLK